MKDDFEISVAPMMDWTDRHFRFFLRLISPNAKLYTEMVTTGALLHGDAERFLRFDNAEHPIALQLGGSNEGELAQCAAMGQGAGYDEINLNCGCPSDRVQSGRFGACLMREPEHVAACVAAMAAETDIPITLKCRIGIDEEDSFEFLDRFVGKSADKGCKTFIIHARKAWLSGLSPKQNREVPPLDYGRAYAIKEKYPELRIVLNGGITTIEQISAFSHSERGEESHVKEGDSSVATLARNDSLSFDGVMIGREAYQNPYLFAEIERDIFGNDDIKGREQIAKAMAPYIEAQMRDYGTPVKSITRHMMGLFHQQAGARAWRRGLSTHPYEDGAGSEVIEKALNDMTRT